MNLTFDIAGIAALVIALITLWKTLSTGKLETTKTKSDVTKALQDLTDNTIERNISLRRRVRNLENQITELKGDIHLFSILCRRCREEVGETQDPVIKEILEKYQKGEM